MSVIPFAPRTEEEKLEDMVKALNALKGDIWPLLAGKDDKFIHTALASIVADWIIDHKSEVYKFDTDDKEYESEPHKDHALHNVIFARHVQAVRETIELHLEHSIEYEKLRSAT